MIRIWRTSPRLLSVLLPLAWVPAAEAAGAPSAPKARMGVGAGVAAELDGVAERDGDRFTLTKTGYVELSVSPSYQLDETWALGLRTSWGFEAGDRGLASSDAPELEIERHLWQLAAEGRYQPGGQRGFYGSAHAGTAGAMDSIGDATAWQWAPLVGAALGYDAHIAGPLALGIELRGSFAAFGNEGASLARGGGSTRYVYGPSSFVSLHFTASLGL